MVTETLSKKYARSWGILWGILACILRRSTITCSAARVADTDGVLLGTRGTLRRRRCVNEYGYSCGMTDISASNKGYLRMRETTSLDHPHVHICTPNPRLRIRIHPLIKHITNVFPQITLINGKHPLTSRRLIPRRKQKGILLAIHREHMREAAILGRSVIRRDSTK